MVEQQLFFYQLPCQLANYEKAKWNITEHYFNLLDSIACTARNSTHARLGIYLFIILQMYNHGRQPT